MKGQDSNLLMSEVYFKIRLICKRDASFLKSRIMKIVFLNSETKFTEEQITRLKKLGKVKLITEANLSKEKAISYLKDADIAGIAPSTLEPVTAEIINACRKLKGIATNTTGYDFVDIKAAARRGIPVCNIPHYATESVAEHTFGLILSLAKNITRSARDVKRGYVKFTDYLGWEIKGKTLGIIGLGDIGTRVAEIGLCFGMKVLAYTRTPKKVKGIKLVTLEKLLKESDAVSIHCPLTAKTKGMIGEKQLSLMKPRAILINTAREAIVDQKAVYKLFKKNGLGGYAFEPDQLMFDRSKDRLVQLENVIVDPHIAWYTKDALFRNSEVWIENVEALVKGKPQYVVNL